MKQIKVTLPENLFEWLEEKAKAENKAVNEVILKYVLAGLAQSTPCLSESTDKPPGSPSDPAP